MQGIKQQNIRKQRLKDMDFASDAFRRMQIILTDRLELSPQIRSSIIQPLSDLLNYAELNLNQGRLGATTKSLSWSQDIIAYDYLSKDL